MAHDPHGTPAALPPEELEALLVRIVGQTAALRGAPAGGSDRDAERRLLADVARLASYLRADAAAHGASLALVIDNATAALAAVAPGAPGEGPS